MDFYQVKVRKTRDGVEVYPDFVVGHSDDLMIRGGAFYAIWDENRALWSKNELDVCRLIDADLYAKARELEATGVSVQVTPLSGYKSRAWTTFRAYCASMPDMYRQLDTTLVFANTPARKENYSSKHLPYNLEPGPISAYEKLMSVLFSPEERQKLEWAVGAIVSGDSKDIQKFIVLYGEAGTGKSTFLHILEQLFIGYWMVFDAKALIVQSNSFATEAFKSNAVVAISHDSDLSRIEDNTVLNTIIAHETMVINEKFRSLYSVRVNSFLFVGTNQSVRITDAKSGLIRRLIDVNPTGNRVPVAEYDVLVSQIGFELGAIAHHCLETYRKMGKNYYSNYRPTDMMIRTDIFYNFLMSSYDMLKGRDGITLKEAWSLYKDYCEEAGFERKMNMHRFRDELRNYFDEFYEKTRVGGVEVRSLFRGFKSQKLNFMVIPEPDTSSIVMDETDSILDEGLAGMPAQYANEDGTPLRKWENVKTTLGDLDTSRLHYVKPPPDHIVIDFDLKGDTGEKSIELNLAAASKFPPTYAEYSQSGSGVHLHYIYTGDVGQLSRIYDSGIEVKSFSGGASLRRKLTKCSNVPVAIISDGLPLKEKRVIDSDTIKSERALRRLLLRNLYKEIHPGTKPSIDFIHTILEEVYASGMRYDVTDMRPRILAFANNSTNHAEYCIRQVMDMKFASEDDVKPPPKASDDRLVFFDVEVFPNLFVVSWKFRGDANVVKMINPSPRDIEELSRTSLVGFNCRRYDNHILYARIMGYSELDLFKLSQRLIRNDQSAFFGDAYNLSYADIYDFSSLKQSLKKFQIELGLNHRELGLPWDQEVDPSMWELVAEYCANDTITTEQVFESRRQDYVARQILAQLSGLNVNDTTQRHTARIIFGDDKNPQDKFVYTDLSGMFPGYKFEAGTSTYKGETVGEGGYVYAEEGMYSEVAVLDVASMHPTSIVMLNLFGPYTAAYLDLKEARLAIKHGDFDRAKRLFGGALQPYLESSEDARALSYALKIVLNIVYGLTSASFPNPFRDPRNNDNIVAKRGALFMIDLKNAVQEMGYKVVHIKTDSIKIPDADPYIIEFVKTFGEKYGYEFEHEVTYRRFCLVNDAVYVAQDYEGQWVATGAQFANPYVFKTLFSKEPVLFDDLCETKTVTTALYLRGEDGEPRFVGRAGAFVPVREGSGGGELLREKDGQFHAASGTKGYSWKEAVTVKELGLEGDVDMNYFRKLVDDAVSTISKFGDFEWFTS
jgi:Family of unknown function (DUF5906)